MLPNERVKLLNSYSKKVLVKAIASEFVIGYEFKDFISKLDSLTLREKIETLREKIEKEDEDDLEFVALKEANDKLQEFKKEMEDKYHMDCDTLFKKGLMNIEEETKYVVLGRKYLKALNKI